jgi:hypothetical protein
MERRCCYCQKEFSIQTHEGDKISHGGCKRHIIEEYIENGLAEHIQKVLSAPSIEFCADMSQVFDG